jgi:hypothetical protein
MKKQTFKAWAIGGPSGVVWTKENGVPCDVPAIFCSIEEANISMPSEFDMHIHGVHWEIHQVRVTVEPIKKPKRARKKK